jgi:hypothetical protein
VRGSGSPLFLHASVAPTLLPPPLWGRRQLRPLIPQPYNQRVRRCLSAAPSSLVSPHDHRFECRWRYLRNPGAPATPPGGSKKKGLFSSAKKNHPGGRSPPASQNREVAEAPFCWEVFRDLVESYSSEVRVSGGGQPGQMPSVGGDGGQRGEEPV